MQRANTMLIVTEGARHRLAQMLDEVQAPAETVVRLVLVGEDGAGEDGMIVTEPGITLPGDTSFEHEGRVVLALDDQVGVLLEGQILYLDDVSQELEICPQRLPSETHEPNRDASDVSRADRRHQDNPGVVSDASSPVWHRVRLEDDPDVIYH
jgi:hypothetical protein